VFSDVTRVQFRSLDEEVIDRYLAVVHTLDKAGGYALQQHGDWLVESVVGSETNVIGLPVEALRQALGDWEILLSSSRDGGTGLGR
jgi:septum formation protein